MRRGVYCSSRANFFMEGKTETSTDWKVGCGTGSHSVDRIVRVILSDRLLTAPSPSKSLAKVLRR